MNHVAIDLETTGLNPRIDQILSWAAYWEDGRAEYGNWNDITTRDRLKSILMDRDNIIVGHNVKFDIGFLQYWLGYPLPKHIQFRDTLLLCWLCNENEANFKLITLAKKYCGIQLKKYEEYGVQASLFEDVKGIEEKCKQDVYATMMLYKNRRTCLEQWPSIVKVYENLYCPLIHVVVEMESVGILIDLPKLDKKRKEWLQKIHECNKWMRDHQYYFPIGSPMRLAEYLFGKKKLQPKPFMYKYPEKYRYANKPLWKTGVDVLKEYVDADPVVPVALDYRRYTKLERGFGVPWHRMANDNQGCLYPSIYQTKSNRSDKEDMNGTDSGRWSCSDPNMYQVDKRSGLRDCIIAPAGMKVIYTDLSQAELRMIAHVTHDPCLTDVYQRGLDLHSITMQELGLSDRTLAKNCNFGLPYGIGGFKFSRQLYAKEGIRKSTEECNEFRTKWFAKYKGVDSYKRVVEQKIERQGYVETILKRRRRLSELFRRGPAKAIRIGFNACIQGSVSDILGLSMLKFFNEKDERTRMLIQVYDSIICIAPCEIAQAEGEKLKTIMETTIKLDVPVVCNMGIGDTWASAERAAH